MEFTSKTVRCNQPGLTQAQALAGLYESYGDDLRVAKIERRGPYWYADIMQRVAEFPPPSDGGEAKPPKFAPDSESEEAAGPPEDESDDSGDESPDGPPNLDGSPDEGKGKDKGAEQEMLHLLHEIAKALGVAGDPADKLGIGGPDDLGAMPPPGPGGPPGGAAPLKKPTKLSPGEVLPTQTPIGSPAFSSVQKQATITVESDPVDPRQVTAAQASRDLATAYGPRGYKLKQLAFDKASSTYRALLSAH